MSIETSIPLASPVAQLLNMDRRFNLVVTTATLMTSGKLKTQYVAFITANVDKYAARVQRMMFDNDTEQIPMFTQAIRAYNLTWYPAGAAGDVEGALANLNTAIQLGFDSIQESRYLEMVRMIGSELAHCIDQGWEAPDLNILFNTDDWMVV